jgi:hypothetical protein
MRYSRCVLSILTLLVLSAARCGSDSPSSDSNERIETFTAVIDGVSYNLEYRLILPEDSSPHPLIIILG